METINELIKQGLEIRDSISPVELAGNDSFIYDFHDENAFIKWKEKVINASRDQKIEDLLNQVEKGQFLPVQMGKVLVALKVKCDGSNTTISPFAPTSTDMD